MTTTIFSPQATSVAEAKAVPMQEIAEQLWNDALAQARQKMTPFHRQAELSELLGVPAFVDAFNHALASGISKILAENDKFLQAVYTYDPSMNPDSESGIDLPASPFVHLLVQASKRSTALTALIDSIDDALTNKLRELPFGAFAQCKSMLDVNVITEEDARRGTGYAVLLSSVFAPPIKVWERNL